ncbi:uncharacterized protein ISCGN_002157 [Ixodes scapularis]
MDQAAWCLLLGAMWTLLDRGSLFPLPNCGETLERNLTTSQPVDVEQNEDRSLENVIHGFPQPVEWDYGNNFQKIGRDDNGLSREVIIAIAVGIGVAFICVVALAVCCCRYPCRKVEAVCTAVIYTVPWQNIKRVLSYHCEAPNDV